MFLEFNTVAHAIDVIDQEPEINKFLLAIGLNVAVGVEQQPKDDGKPEIKLERTYDFSNENLTMTPEVVTATAPDLGEDNVGDDDDAQSSKTGVQADNDTTNSSETISEDNVVDDDDAEDSKSGVQPDHDTTNSSKTISPQHLYFIVRTCGKGLYTIRMALCMLESDRTQPFHTRKKQVHRHRITTLFTYLNTEPRKSSFVMPIMPIRR